MLGPDLVEVVGLPGVFPPLVPFLVVLGALLGPGLVGVGLLTFLPAALIVGCSGHVIVTVLLCCPLTVLVTVSSFLTVALIVYCSGSVIVTVSIVTISLTVAFVHLHPPLSTVSLMLVLLVS